MIFFQLNFPDLIVSRHLIVAKHGRDPNLGTRGLISPITLPQRKPRRATRAQISKKDLVESLATFSPLPSRISFSDLLSANLSEHGHYICFWSEETDIAGPNFPHFNRKLGLLGNSWQTKYTSPVLL
jgi:hypothetical protein